MEFHDLYGLPLAQFTEQRNALVKELRQQGQRDEAAAVAKLRKPSVAAWAVNQLVRTQRRDVDALLKAGDALQRAQAELVAKRGDPSRLRRAVEAERAAVEQLLGKARGLLDSDGHELTAPRLAQVTETLHAAALDDEARASVRDGCLERELQHVGLGSIGGVDTGAPSGRSSRARQARKPSARQKPASRLERERVSRQERAANERTAREAEATARRRLERARRQQRTAERRRERAAADLRDAEAMLAAARDTAAQAEAELHRARRVLDDL